MSPPFSKGVSNAAVRVHARREFTLEIGFMIREGERSRSGARALGAVTST